MTVENGAMHHVPTLAERTWRWLGFRYHLGSEPDGVEQLPGWMCTESGIRFDWKDRLRLLVSGHLRMRLVQYTSVQVEGTKNRLDWHIVAPGERT
jgi:hypothetical protein